MITAEIFDEGCRLSNLPREAETAIKARCSYKVAGAKYSEAFRSHVWDGKVKLWRADNGSIKVPIGLARDAIAACKKSGHAVKVIDHRLLPPREEYTWNPAIVLRDHQIAAVASLDIPGPHRGVGTVKMPIRSGKTITGAAIIRALSARAIFVVPTLQLLRQAQADLQACLQEPIGVIGDGTCDVRRVTVATAGSLAAMKRTNKTTFAKLSFGTLIVDEMHHLKGGAWTKAVAALKCRFRVGLSATAYFGDDDEIDKGILQARAICGGIVHDVSITEMVEAGFLIAPDIMIHTCNVPDLWNRRRWSPKLADDAIHMNAARNAKIASLAAEHAAEGSRVIVICQRLSQVDDLSKRLEELQVTHSTVRGADESAGSQRLSLDPDERAAQRTTRAYAIKELVSGRRPVAISTVLGEGVNIPEVDVVIIAGGGKDAKATMQRMRCLTASPGKTRAVVHDFLDMNHEYCERHSEARLAVYRSEKCFKVHVLPRSKDLCVKQQSRHSSRCPF